MSQVQARAKFKGPRTPLPKIPYIGPNLESFAGSDLAHPTPKWVIAAMGRRKIVPKATVKNSVEHSLDS
ncbi:hypothetical protein BO1005MUT1_510115 [Hyphomicrobiales bacterium]|nr:hypothetical protein BO1005MUT1_510115 [Hyphomicrobiales bacterium]